ARLSAMVGFRATSNVEAARRYQLTVAGTMAHSYIEAFESQLEAFRAFAEDFPARTTFLVDTFDTVSGINDAIKVIRELDLQGQIGIRLDSGDLGELARRGRRLLDRAGLEKVRIFASGGLDEFPIDGLVREAGPMNGFGGGSGWGVRGQQSDLTTATR